LENDRKPALISHKKTLPRVITYIFSWRMRIQKTNTTLTISQYYMRYPGH